MKYEYKNDCIAEKLLHANRVTGLPKNIKVNFDVMHVRFYSSEEHKGFFYCQLAIPALTEEDDFVFEREFDDFSAISRFDSDEGDNGFYEAPLLALSCDALPASFQCQYELKVIDGKESLLLVVVVKGTPFIGYVAFEDYFHTKIDM